jgi:hypothetical protein
LGTAELLVLSGEATSDAAVDQKPSSTMPSPPFSAAGVVSDERASNEYEVARGSPPSAPTTVRADALRIMGSLAHRLAAEGRVEEAQRALIGHLRGLLRGAHSGLDVAPELCELAAQYALDVARWSADATWLDYVLELHLAARQLMSHELIVGIETTELWMTPCDRLLLSYYVESLERRCSTFSNEERSRYELLKKLALT